MVPHHNQPNQNPGTYFYRGPGMGVGVGTVLGGPAGAVVDSQFLGWPMAGGANDL
jgi:hypothetical protein